MKIRYYLLNLQFGKKKIQLIKLINSLVILNVIFLKDPIGK